MDPDPILKMVQTQKNPEPEMAKIQNLETVFNLLTQLADPVLVIRALVTVAN